MNIQRKLGLIRRKGYRELHLTVVVIDTVTEQLIERGYVGTDNVINYLKYGMLISHKGVKDIEVVYYADTIGDIISQVNLLKVFNPQELPDSFLNRLDIIIHELGI